MQGERQGDWSALWVIFQWAIRPYSLVQFGWPCLDTDVPHSGDSLQLSWTYLLSCSDFSKTAARSRSSLVAENLFLRKQLAFYEEHEKKPRRLTDGARIALVFLSRWLDWKQALTIVQPETLIRWHRRGFKLFWRWKSKPGRPRLPRNIRELPFGGSLTSSTVPFILVSVLTSYLGRFVSWAFCATKRKAQRIAIARKIDFQMVLHEWGMALGMAPAVCSYPENEAIFANSDIVLHFQRDGVRLPS